MAVGGRDFLRVLSFYSIEGIEVSSPQDLVIALEGLLRREDIVLILVDKGSTGGMQEQVRRLKLEVPVPLIIELNRRPALREIVRFLEDIISK